MIAEAIFARLTTVAGVTALIGNRLYPEYNRQAQKTYPLAVYKVSKFAGGASNSGSININGADVIIAAISPLYTTTAALADAIIDALDCQRGTWGAAIVQGCFLKDDGVEDGVVTQPETEEILYHVKHLSFEIRYT